MASHEESVEIAISRNGAGVEASLSAEERMEFSRCRAPQRQAEWLAARWAIKYLMSERGKIARLRECSIRKEPEGRPYAHYFEEGTSGGKRFPVSISHKNGIACVCVSYLSSIRVGIDIESLSPRAWRVRHAFAHPEDGLIAPEDLPKSYAVLWACKEAVTKVMGKGLLMDFKKILIRLLPKSGFRALLSGGDVLRGFFFEYHPYIVAFCSDSDTIDLTEWMGSSN